MYRYHHRLDYRTYHYVDPERLSSFDESIKENYPELYDVFKKTVVRPFFDDLEQQVILLMHQGKAIKEIAEEYRRELDVLLNTDKMLSFLSIYVKFNKIFPELNIHRKKKGSCIC